VFDLEILGPLVVRVGGRQIRLGPMLRILLLGLLCAGGDLVPASRLASLLSETGKAQSSPATLRSHVSHLRRALSGVDETGGRKYPPVLVTDQVGGSTAYALRVHTDHIDASRFERAVLNGIRQLHNGNFEFAGEELGAAMDLWRGQPLADVADHAFAQDEIRRLEGMHRAALVGRFQADIQRGLYRAVIGELESMARLWPHDEEIRVLLVICLYRSGRSAEAAQACRAAVAAALEHGLDSPRLTALQFDVLSGSLSAVGLPHMPSVPGRTV
jgi:DNA-binding SARP family transcriptional activator